MAEDRCAADRDAPQRLRASTIGTIYCIFSALFYVLMGICQRELSKGCDPVWVNCVQAWVSSVVFGVYLACRSMGGRPTWPPLAVIAGLMALGAVTQVGASIYQWSLGIIGLAIGNPLQTGIMLAASAVMGWFALGERVTGRGMAAILLITASTLLLGFGADAASKAIRPAEPAASLPASAADDLVARMQPSGRGDQPKLQLRPGDSGQTAGGGVLRVFLAVGAASLSGIAFAILSVGIRKATIGSTSPEAIVFFINVMGILFLGPWALARLGLDGIRATPPRDLAVMLATGACNLIGFLLVTKAFQQTTVVRVNSVNNSLTTALTVVAGIVIFAEPYNRELVIGIFLMLGGVVLISNTEAVREETA